jgi:hypothetical protein
MDDIADDRELVSPVAEQMPGMPCSKGSSAAEQVNRLE